jgi:hypothetical protein
MKLTKSELMKSFNVPKAKKRNMISYPTVDVINPGYKYTFNFQGKPLKIKEPEFEELSYLNTRVTSPKAFLKSQLSTSPLTFS